MERPIEAPPLGRIAHGAADGNVGSTAMSAAAASAMRLGVKLEARGDVQRLVAILQQRLSAAGRDLQVR